jgi:hypothetical protein
MNAAVPPTSRSRAILRPNEPVVLIACKDITERKRAQETLRHSKAYLAEAERLSLTGSWAWSPATGDIRWSEECTAC